MDTYKTTAQLFRAEADRIIAAFGQNLIALHQLGRIHPSRYLAKPIIEIWVEVANIEKIHNLDFLTIPSEDCFIDVLSWHMVELGYLPRGEQGIAGRRFFSKDSDTAATYHVHAYQFGHFQPDYPQNSPGWSSLMHWLTAPDGVDLPREMSTA